MSEQKANYHTHTSHCGHAEGLPEDYAKEAVKAGLSVLGFSDHAPFRDKDFYCRMQYPELDIYCSEVQNAKKKFSEKLEILCSLEIEYLPEYNREKSYYEYLLTEKKIDYLLCGEHFFRDRAGNMHNITSITESSLAVEYAYACKDAMETGFFKILAHPDLFCINEPWGWNKDYEKAADIIIETAEKTGVILEFNANGLRRGKKAYPDGERWQYPHERFWGKVKNAGLCAIVGSDAHSPDLIWDKAVSDSIDILRNSGIERITVLKL